MNPEPTTTESVVLPTIEEPSQDTKPRFLVLPHLIVVGVLLLGVFSTVVTATFDRVIDQITPPKETAPFVMKPAAVVVPTIAKDTVSIKARAAHVVDLTTGTVLFEKNADEALPLASLTKLMTALVAFEVVDPETYVTITRPAAQLESGGTLTMGEIFTVADLTAFSLVSSFNSAAYMLAFEVGKLLGDRDPMAQFITAMNLTAYDLQLSTLSFKNSTGLDIDTKTPGAEGSARDISALMAHLFTSYPELLQKSTLPSLRIYNKQGSYHDAHNTNDVLPKLPNLYGSKTGYTDLAGGNLTILFDAGFNRPIVVTVLGSTRNERFEDVLALVQAAQAAITTN